jgi:hypothetical protein
MRAADQILDESFLEVRAKLLEVAATLDRIDRGAEQQRLSPPAEQRRHKIQAAIQICLSDDADRATRLQRLFSRDYDGDWRTRLQV